MSLCTCRQPSSRARSAEHLEQLEGAIHNHKRVTFDMGRTAPAAGALPRRPPGPSVESSGSSARASARSIPTGLCIAKGPGCWSACATKRRRFAASGSTASCSSRSLRGRGPPTSRCPRIPLQEHGVISPWRFDREPPVRARLWVSDETLWVVDEDFGSITRTPAQDHVAGRHRRRV